MTGPVCMKVGHRVVDIGTEPVFKVEIVTPGQIGVHPDHLGGNDLQQGVLEAGKHVSDQASCYGVGLEQHQRALDASDVTHVDPL